MQKLKSILGAVVLVAVAVLYVLFFVCCKTFDPIQVEGQPDICNDMYTVMSFNYKNGIKDTALVLKFADKCMEKRDNADKTLKDELCRKSYFPEGVIDKANYQQYTGYLECLK